MLNFTFIRALPSSVPSFHAGWTDGGTDDLYQDDYDGGKKTPAGCAGRLLTSSTKVRSYNLSQKSRSLPPQERFRTTP